MLLLALLLTVAAMGPPGAQCQRPKVTISGLGTVVGETVTYRRDDYPAIDTKVDIYRGIPFAEPPERWAKPEPKQPWSGNLDASAFGKSCRQIPLAVSPFKMSENCLYMNIWVPNPKPKNAAVMVYIHGGGFVLGAGSEDIYDGSSLAAYGDTIVVNFNYRLGVFGFLSTGDSELPGNYGMWDQVEALKFVKQHIADFGGDSNRITIFGESAGGVSVSLMTLAKPAWPYFNRAIMQSGTATSPWGVLDKEAARKDAFELGSMVDCSETTTAALAHCLKTRGIFRIQRAFNKMGFSRLANRGNVIPFVPTVDGEFLTDDPAKLYARGEFKQSDVLVGTVRDEGALIVYKALMLNGLPWSPDLGQEKFDDIIGDYVYVDPSNTNLDLIRDQYVSRTETNYFWPFVRITTDEAFLCPSDFVAKAFASQSANHNTYLFQMTHVPAHHYIAILPWEDIVIHGDDIAFVFGGVFQEDLKVPVQLTKEGIDLTVDMMRYWSNFAKTGDPNLGESKFLQTANAATWAKFTTISMDYMELGTSPTGKQGLRQEACSLWNDRLAGSHKGRAKKTAKEVNFNILKYLLL